MNTDCSKCMFFENNSCFFNIRNIVSDRFNIIDSCIEDYYCSYGFGKETYQNNMYIHTREQIIENIIEKNKLEYLLYTSITDSSQIIKIADIVNNLGFMLEYLCIYCENIDAKDIETFNTTIKKDIKWRISHKGDQDSTNFNIFLGICGAFLNKSSANMLVLHSDELENIDSIINEVHIDNKILHSPNIRISNNLQIIFIPSTQLIYLNFEELFNNTSNYIQNINYIPI